MQLYRALFLIIIFGIACHFKSFSQSCPLDNNYWASDFITPPLGNPYPCEPGSRSMSLGAGTFAELQVQNGVTYIFSTCGSPFDTKITGYPAATPTPLFNNDDNGPACAGTSASAEWTATFNGFIWIMMDVSGCDPCFTPDTTTGAAPTNCPALGSAVLAYSQKNNIVFTSSSAAICAGESRALTATPAGGTFSGTGVSGTTFNAPATGGVVPITYTFNQCSAVQNLTVNEKPAVTIDGGDGFCQGGSILLTANAIAGSGVLVAWEWKRNNVSIGGANASTYTATLPGDYTVIVTNSNGCSTESPVKVITEYLNPTVLISGDTSICAGFSAQLVADATAGSGTITNYQWKRNGANVGANSNTHTTSQTGDYTVEVTNSFGCTTLSSVLILEEFQNPSVSISGDTSYCAGESLVLTAIASAGSGTIVFYQWKRNGVNVGTNNVNYTVTQPGNYTVVVFNSRGCSTESSIKPILEIASPIVVITGDTAFCAGGGTVTLTSNASAGSGTITSYQWKVGGGNIGGATDTFYTVSVAGLYSLVVTNSNGCSTESVSSTVLESPLPVVTISKTDISCFGFDDGSISSTVSIGKPPYKYLWSNGDTNATATGLGVGSYDLTVTDRVGCQGVSNTVTILEPTELTIEAIDSSDASCQGINNGSITVVAAGGTTPPALSFSVNGGPSQPSGFFGGLSAGFYTAMVQDANGCQATVSVTIDNLSAITLVVDSIKNVSCNGLNDGLFIMEATGGTSPYEYTTNGIIFTTNPVFNNRVAGIYPVLVRDAVGCQAAVEVTITQPSALTAVVDNITHIACNGDSLGSIEVTVAGGSPPYSYLWSNGDTSQDLSNLPAGVYTLTVTDTNNCTTTVNGTITQPGKLFISLANLSHVSCNGGQDGEIDVSIAGGTAPFLYLWSDGHKFEDNTQLVAGTYSLTVFDANGCTETDTFIITEPLAALDVVLAKKDITCQGDNDGMLSATVSGGTPPYSYLWNNGLTIGTIAPLLPGIYSLTVQDANGCIKIVGQTVNVLSNISIIDTITNVACHGDSIGSIQLTLSGGVSPYTFNWSNSATTQNLTNVPAGGYAVTVTDDSLCTKSANYLISQPLAFNISLASLVHVSCHGDDDGKIDITVTGGVPPYSFLWSTGDTLEDNLSLTAGVYSVTATDDNGCMETKSFTINEPAQPLSLSFVIQDVTCLGDNDGQASATATGGTPPYSYLWNVGFSTPNITGLPAGLYAVTATDDNGCIVVANGTINPLSNMVISDSVVQIVCQGDLGAIYTSVSGGIAPYDYSWSNGATSQNLTNVTAGFYTVSITDDSMCVATKNYFINDFGLVNTPVLNFSYNTTCVGQPTHITNLSTGIQPGAIYYLDILNDGTVDFAVPAASLPTDSSLIFYLSTDTVIPFSVVVINPVGCTDTFIGTLIIVDCDDGDPCTIDSCYNGLCFNTPLNCDDSDPCTIDFCFNGVCMNVLDTFVPAAACVDLTVYLDSSGEASITPQQLDGRRAANCGMDSLSISQSQFTCFDIGIVSVVLTVTENNGTTSTCTANVTVEDSLGLCPPCELTNSSVLGCTLVYESNFGEIRPLVEGDTIAKDTLCRFNIRADICPEIVGSVVFEMSGAENHTHVENNPPYAFFGDYGPFDYKAWKPTRGFYTLTVTPYSGRGGSGIAGTPYKIHFTVINGSGSTSTSCAKPTVDCNGDMNGNAYVDYCGNCVGGNTGLQPCPVDCNNEPGGTAFIDTCGQCAGGNTGIIPDLCNCALTVTSFSLVDAAANSIVGPLDDGDTINLSVLPSFTIKANVCDPVGSVRFFVNGSPEQLENNFPYVIAGDNDNGNYYPWNAGPGVYTISATPYPNGGGHGSAGTGNTITIYIIDQNGNCNGVVNGDEVVGFSLVNAATNTVIGPLNDGDIINKSLLPSFTVQANVCKPVGSVWFLVNGQPKQLENNIPYVIAGDNDNGNYYPWNVGRGFYTITANPYSLRGGNGTLGIGKTINIQVVTSSYKNSLVAGQKPFDEGVNIFPNPFKDWVTIEVRLAETTRIRLEIITIDGRQLATLHEGIVDGGELFSTEFSSGNLSDGLYICRLITESGEIYNRRLMLIR